MIQRLVFQNREYSLPEFVAILDSDWADQESLRHRVQKEFDFYGNDSDEADAMLRRVYDDFTTIVSSP